MAIFSRDALTGRLAFVGTAVDLRTHIVVFSPDGAYLYVTGTDETSHRSDLYRRNVTTGALELVGPTPGVLFISPDGKHAYGNGVYEPDPTTGQLTLVNRRIDVLFGDVLAFRPDGQFLYRGFDGSLDVVSRNAESGSLGVVQRLPGSAPRDLALSPDGSQLFAATGTVVVYSWGTKRGKLGLLERLELPFSPGNVFERTRWVVASPDGRALYVGSSTLNRFSGIDALTVFRVSPCGPLTSSKLTLKNIGTDPAPGNDVLGFKGNVKLRGTSFASTSSRPMPECRSGGARSQQTASAT